MKASWRWIIYRDSSRRVSPQLWIVGSGNASESFNCLRTLISKWIRSVGNAHDLRSSTPPLPAVTSAFSRRTTRSFHDHLHLTSVRSGSGRQVSFLYPLEELDNPPQRFSTLTGGRIGSVLMKGQRLD